MADVTPHNKPSDCWLVIYTFVYDVTAFYDVHPAPTKGSMFVCGGDTTTVFRCVLCWGLCVGA